MRDLHVGIYVVGDPSCGSIFGVKGEGEGMRKKKANKYDHEAITRDLLASPNKCIDGEVALKYGCVKSYVSTLRKRYTDIRFKTGTPRKRSGVSIETTRVDYWGELKAVMAPASGTKLYLMVMPGEVLAWRAHG